MDIKSSPLVQFLLEACSQDIKLAMLSYWHLTVETESKNTIVGKWFKTVKRKLVDHLFKENQVVYRALINQVNFKRRLHSLSQKILKENNTNQKRRKALRRALSDQSQIGDLEGGADRELFLINPDKKVTTLNPDEATIFKSNTAPFLLSFNSK